MSKNAGTNQFELRLPLCRPQRIGSPAEFKIQMNGEELKGVCDLNVSASAGGMTSINLEFAGSAVIDTLAETYVSIDFSFEQRRVMGELLGEKIKHGLDIHDWDALGEVAVQMFEEIFSYALPSKK